MTVGKFRPISKGLFVFLIVVGMALLLSESRTRKTLATDSVEIDSSAILSDTLLENKMKQEISGIGFDNPTFRGSELNRAISNNAFGAGERLVYSVGYGMIKAGEASLEVEDVTKLDGNKCFHIISTAKSNKFFSFFFNVDDRVESYMDVYGLFSLRFEKHLIEGKFRAEAYVQFDQKRSLAISGKDTISTSHYVQDALSVLYYARTQKLEVGKSISVDNYADRKNYLLEIKVHRKETVEVPAGKFDCIVVEPQLKGSTIFKHEGKLTVWLTDDEKKMPVLMKSKAFIGSVSASLKEYRLGEVGKY
ncbi:MAG: DUF3108 domain-containing protein [candidate division Zixibacteria bacterium]|nr:DUF3108 domain-containing protein [candidate division Zixibacteria bacterium]